jgi:hypothetical protein
MKRSVARPIRLVPQLPATESTRPTSSLPARTTERLGLPGPLRVPGAEKGKAMVDTNLDLVIQGQLDLRIAGSIGLLEGGGQKRPDIQHSKKPGIQHSRVFLPGSHREQEANEQIVGKIGGQHRLSWDEIESDDCPSGGGSRSQPRGTLSRAAGETRQAISELSKSMKSADAQRIRRATA